MSWSSSEKIVPVAGVHRLPPHSVEGEQGVLGSMLVSPRAAIAECVEKLTPDHFYVPAHGTIYRAMVELWEAGKAIDLITFTQVLRDKNLLEAVGGAAFVTSLFTFVPTAANVEYYIEIVREKFILREIIAKCTELVRCAYEEQDEVSLLLDRAQADLTALSIRNGQRENAKHIRELMVDLMERIEHAYFHRGHAAEAAGGLATGFTDLDRMTGGLKPQELIVIGARTSHGKTSLAINIVEHVATQLGKAVAVFSMEMSAASIANRLGASAAGFSIQRVRDGMFSRLDFGEVAKKFAPLMASSLWIDDSPAIWTSDFKARARRMVARFGVNLIVVDYLQKMVSPTERAKRNRAIEVSEIAQCLKNTAKELNIPIICAAQLNRQPGERKFGYPKLSDLRESGDIENEADLCLLLWRPERECEGSGDYEALAKKLKIKAEDDNERKQMLKAYARLIVAKQRDGAVGEIPLRFESDRTKFHSVTKKEYSNREDERQQTRFSNHLDERQEKDAEAAFLASVKENFPNAMVMETNRDGEHP
jgi:replicative DNA helicase